MCQLRMFDNLWERTLWDRWCKFINCCLDYCKTVLVGIAEIQIKQLQSVQNMPTAIRLVLQARVDAKSTPKMKVVARPNTFFFDCVALWLICFTYYATTACEVGGKGVCGSSARSYIRYLSVRRLTPILRDTYKLSGRISIKLVTNMHRVSENYRKKFQGHRSKVKGMQQRLGIL